MVTTFKTDAGIISLAGFIEYSVSSVSSDRIRTPQYPRSSAGCATMASRARWRSKRVVWTAGGDWAEGVARRGECHVPTANRIVANAAHAWWRARGVIMSSRLRSGERRLHRAGVAREL